MLRTRVLLLVLVFPGAAAPRSAPAQEREFRAGAAAVDITPSRFPIRVNGGIREALATRAIDPLHSRALVLDDGATRIAIAVVDSCMLPRDLIDAAKEAARERTGIPSEHMLVSATHTHTAPAVMGCHGTDPDPEYRAELAPRIAESIALADRRRVPARIGWGAGHSAEWVFCRRWVMKPGKARSVPFTGRESDRVQMNPGHGNPDRERQTGPVDTAVTVLSLETRDGTPLALLANYSTHYAGSSQVSADYFGEFARLVEERLGKPESASPFVAMISNGTSGDANCIDYSRPARREFTHLDVARAMADVALATRATIEHADRVPLDMLERRLELGVRKPTAEETARARAFLAEHMADGKVENLEENYARETVLLAEYPARRELKLQALRAGDFAMTAIPCEVFGSTGLGIKKKSPFALTMNVSLANGAEGYIPPPAQFELGGYTTWRARTSCLEVDAEPKIAAAVAAMLEELRGE